MTMHEGTTSLLRWRPSRLCLLTLILIATPIIYFIGERSLRYEGYALSSSPLTSSYYSLEQMREFAFKNSIATDYKPYYYTRWNFSFNRMLEDLDNRILNKILRIVREVTFGDLRDWAKEQRKYKAFAKKTAGTSFEKFLVKHLNISNPCACHMGKKRCVCHRPGSTKKIWLFSRYSTGWVCGLHADYTELFVSGCVDNALDRKEGVHRKRRYFYTSFLREPVSRFISEYRHVERGATWLAARHICNGRPPTPEQLPMCFDPEVGWDGVTLDQFLACPYNLAFNRQTRMLADLTLVNCYDTRSMDVKTRERIMLESAKNNLKNLAFFGIKERMAESQWMFEQLFQLRFTKDLSNWTKSKSNDTEITQEQLELIKQKNNLDIQLYAYAQKLFLKRLKQLRSDDYASVPEIKRNASEHIMQSIAVKATSKRPDKTHSHKGDEEDSKELTERIEESMQPYKGKADELGDAEGGEDDGGYQKDAQYGDDVAANG